MSKPSQGHGFIAYRQSEQGVVLVVVLLFLVLIMLAGVIAVQQSKTDLKTATADQINTALLHAADSANHNLETLVNGDSNTQTYKDSFSYVGLFGHYLQDPDASKDEYVYCFNPKTQHYLRKNATINREQGILDNINKGICDYNDPDSYSSTRQILMTQVSLQMTPPKDTDEAFSQQMLGQDSTATTNKKYKFDIRATSLLPAYSEPTNCLANSSANRVITSENSLTNPLLDCLHKRITPSKMLYQQADLENTATIKMCIPFGSGSLDSCVLVSNPAS